MDNSYAPLMRSVAEILLGTPNKKLSSQKEYRYGTYGSLSIDLEEGVWQDFETKTGGGVRDLIAYKTGCSDSEVTAWLKKHDLLSPERDTTEIIKPAEKKHIATYDYINPLGEVVYQVLRFDIVDGLKKKKTFLQRRKDETNTYVYNLNNIASLPYRLDVVTEAVAQGKQIFIVEGEKDVEKLLSNGIPATTNSGGASNWKVELNGYFSGAHVVIVPDNDEPGRKHASDVARSLQGYAATIKLLELPNLPEKGDVSDWFDAGGTVDLFNELVKSKAIPYAGEKIFRTKFNAIKWSDLDLPAFEHEWIVKGILARGERSMVAGPSQSGKSFAVLDIALSVARGVDYQAFAQIGGEGSYNLRSFKTRRGGVIYQAGEGGRGLKKRLRAYRKFHELESQTQLPFVLLPCPVDLYGKEEPTTHLIQEITHWATTFDCPLELVVIDTLSAATPGANENASEDMSKVLMRCERIARETGAHVMFVHHMNASGERPRGHTSIFANLDSVLTIKRTEEKEAYKENYPGRDIREITLTKNKDSEDGTNIRFVLKSIPLGEDEDGEPITSCVCIPPEDQCSIRTPQKPIKLNSDLQFGMLAFFKAVDEKGLDAPIYLKLPRGVRVVSVQNFKSTFYAMSPEGFDLNDADKEKKIRSIFDDVVRGLMSKTLITGDASYLWHTGQPVRELPRSFASQKTSTPLEKPWEDT